MKKVNFTINYSQAFKVQYMESKITRTEAFKIKRIQQIAKRYLTIEAF